MFIAYHLFDLENEKVYGEIGEFKKLSYNYKKHIASISFSDNSKIYLYFETLDDYQHFFGDFFSLMEDVEKPFALALSGICFNDMENYEACINEINLLFESSWNYYDIDPIGSCSDSQSFRNYLEEQLCGYNEELYYENKD